MDRNLLYHIGRTCSVLKTHLDSGVFQSIRRLGIGRRIPTKRGTRAGRLFRLWYNLPTNAQCHLSTTAVVTEASAHPRVPRTTVKTLTTATQSESTRFSMNLKIMHLNAQSCGNKALELADTITDDDFDIVFLSETWLKQVGDEAKITELTPSGFILKNMPRTTGSGGGLAVLYRNSLAKAVSIRSDCTAFTTFDLCELRLYHQGRTLTFIFLYRPPPSKKNKLTSRIFVQEFQDLLDGHLATKDLFVIGDVNLHFDSDKETYSVLLKNALKDRNLDQLVNVPTHVKGHTLDWLVTNASELIENLSIDDRGLSDHFLLSLHLRLEKLKKPKKTVTSRKLKDIDIASFKLDAAAKLSQLKDNDLLINYNTCLRKLLDSYAPLCTRTVTDRPSAPWMSDDIKAAKLLRRRAEREYKRTGLTVHRQVYVQAKNKVNRMVRDAKTCHITRKIEAAESSRELFGVTNELLSGANKPVLPTSMPIADLPDAFNQFFIGKIEQIRHDMPPPTTELDQDPVFHGPSFSDFDCVSEARVKDIILKMPKKSCDLDPIPYIIFIDCLDEIVPTITQIMNNSLTTGVVPKSFKHALVKPLIKKPNMDPECLKNYRPVSNLPFLSKVLERIVLEYILAHLEKHNLIENFQSAYRKCRSTETALVRVLNDLLRTSDAGHVSILSMLDLSAAFDTLDHEILLARFSLTFGFSGTTLKWIRSYLTERTQSVVIDGSISESSALKYGVPQGSVLGPVLFTMYTYPLSGIIRPYGISYHFFADDSQLYDSRVPSEFPQMSTNISGAVASVCAWMTKNQLKMNEDKTEVIRIGTRNKMAKVQGPESLTVMNCEVPFIDKVKNLGVHIDSTLSFDAHIGQLCRGLYLQLRRIGQIRPYLSIDSTKKLVVAFVLSRLDYCNALLAGLSEEKIAKLQRIQNNAARLVLRKSKRDSVTALLHELHWLPVSARIDYKVATLCHQCIYGSETPMYLKELIQPYVPRRSLRSNDSTLLVVPRFSLQTYGLRAFSVNGPKVWNSLPIELRQTTSYLSFKKHLKTHLFISHLN